ncbi:MAG: hypothetical protein LUF02_05750 [Erysipelotrichaceae bacterium]|nr:hypothetical protein [Erysipelotrichaceae bacterium]
MKPFKTIDEQLDLLKSRGLIFTNEDKAKQYLLNNNSSFALQKWHH